MPREVSTHTDPDAHLVHLLHTKLPQELRDEILVWIFEIELCPGAFHSDQPPRFELLGVSKRLQQKYEKRMWSETTFVVGNPRHSNCQHNLYIWQLPPRATSNIAKVHLGFSIRDLGDRWANFWPKHIKHQHPEMRTGDDTLKMVQDYHPHHYRKNLSASLFRVWAAKVSALNGLPLEELTLDFSECYDFNGRWRGAAVAHIYRINLRTAPVGTRPLGSIKTLDIVVPEGNLLSMLRRKLGLPSIDAQGPSQA